MRKCLTFWKLFVPDLNPTQILLNFEKASMKTPMTSFPQADIIKRLLFSFMPKFIEKGQFCWAKAQV